MLWKLMPSISRSLYRFAVLALVLVSPIEFASAVDLHNRKYTLQRRSDPDRIEGIEGIKISGGVKLDLVSAILNVPGQERTNASDKYRLGFYLQKRENRVQIKVRDYNFFNGEFHYWMRPSRKRYESEFQEFVWGASIVRELGLRLNDLGAVTNLGGHGYPVVAPALLQAAPFPRTIRPRGLQFVFIANETVTVRYRLFQPHNRDRILLWSGGEQWLKGRKNTVSWQGVDSRGVPAIEGTYRLEVTATVPRRGKKAEEIAVDYEFYYRPEIAYRP